MTATILSSRRQTEPYGLEGGEAGKKGQNLVTRKDGKTLKLGGNEEIHMEEGDIFTIKTPGGGGYGKS